MHSIVQRRSGLEISKQKYPDGISIEVLMSSRKGCERMLIEDTSCAHNLEESL